MDKNILNLLIIDDESEDFAKLQAIFKNNFNIIETEYINVSAIINEESPSKSAEAVIEKFVRPNDIDNTVHSIILDIHLGEHNPEKGLSILQEIKNYNPKNPDDQKIKRYLEKIPIFIISRYGSDSPTRERAIRYGAKNIYPKSEIFENKYIKQIYDASLLYKNNIKESQKKIFVSHSSKDKNIVETFCDMLLQKALGLRKEIDYFCTIYPDSIPNGKGIKEHILLNLRKCTQFICLISDNYNKSNVCQNELGAAWGLGKEIKYLTTIDYNDTGFIPQGCNMAKIDQKDKLISICMEICETCQIKTDLKNIEKNVKSFINKQKRSHKFNSETSSIR